MVDHRHATAHAEPAAAPTLAADIERTELAHAALQAHFFLDQYNIYRDFAQTHPRLSHPFASNWSFSVAARAAQALTTLPDRGEDARQDLKRLVSEGLERYWDAAGSAYNSEVLPPLGIGFGPECFRFYDDNAHVALLLVEYAEKAQDEWALARAREICDEFLLAGVEADSLTLEDGIRWAQTPDSEPHFDRNLVSNAPCALLGLLLYQYTGEHHFFRRAAPVINWCNEFLRDKADGLYWDKVRANGTIDYAKWTYNQGYMIGVYSQLYKITLDARHLAVAENIARSSLEYFGSSERGGVARLIHQDPDFNAVLFRYLARLLELSEDRGLRESIIQTIAAYRDTVWNTPEYHQDGHLFTLPCQSSPLRMQAAMVEIFSLQIQ